MSLDFLPSSLVFFFNSGFRVIWLVWVVFGSLHIRCIRWGVDLAFQNHALQKNVLKWMVFEVMIGVQVANVTRLRALLRSNLFRQFFFLKQELKVNHKIRIFRVSQNLEVFLL